jgi:hypothetical protein
VISKQAVGLEKLKDCRTFSSCQRRLKASGFRIHVHPSPAAVDSVSPGFASSFGDFMATAPQFPNRVRSATASVAQLFSNFKIKFLLHSNEMKAEQT